MKELKITAKIMNSIVSLSVNKTFSLYINGFKRTVNIKHVENNTSFTNCDVAFTLSDKDTIAKHFVSGHTLLFKYWRYRLPLN
jgi:hypothetical protein